MKAFICEDLTVFHFTCHCSMFLVLTEQAKELSGKAVGDSPALQVNVSTTFLDLGRSSETRPCSLFDLWNLGDSAGCFFSPCVLSVEWAP